MADEPIVESQVAEGEAGGQVEGGEPEGAVAETIDPGLVSRATKEFFLAEDDVKAAPHVVERMMSAADRMAGEAYRRAVQQAQQGGPSPAAAGYTPPPQQQAPGAPQFSPFELKFEADADQDSPVVKNMSGMNAHMAKQFEALHKHYEEKFKQYEGFQQNVQRQQSRSIVDGFISTLGPEWATIYGRGSWNEHHPQSPESLKRGELETAAVTAIEVHRLMTGQQLSESEALRRAHTLLNQDKFSAIERAKAEAKRKELQASASVRPKASGAAPANGSIRSRATALTDMMRRA